MVNLPVALKNTMYRVQLAVEERRVILREQGSWAPIDIIGDSV
jgi:hypothetical protein